MIGRTIKIKAVDVIKCIRSGMDDTAIMEHFGISSGGLRTLFQQLVQGGIINPGELAARKVGQQSSVVVDPRSLKLEAPPSKPIIDAADALRAVRAGLTDGELMVKYNLSAQGVQSLINKLIRVGAISIEDVERRNSSDESITLEEVTERTRRVVFAELVDEIKSGTERVEILRRYKIAEEDLDELLMKLVDQGLLLKPNLTRAAIAHLDMFEIRHRVTGEPMYRAPAASLAQLANMAVRARADLSECDLSGADLARADLSGGRFARALFRNAYLVGADLTGANLTEAVFTSSNMFGAVLYKANFSGADLSDSNLSMVYAVWAFMPGANFAESNLTKANFSGAHLHNAQMFEAILSETNLTGAYLEGCNIKAARMEGPRAIIDCGVKNSA